MNQTFEYVERRLEPQEEWHNKRARLNKWLFYTVEVATLLAGAAIPVVNLWAVKDAYLAGVLSAILGGVVVMAAAIHNQNSELVLTGEQKYLLRK